MPRWEHGSEERLKQAARELFDQQGFERTSVVEIAARARVTTRTFFRYFADKQEVLFAGLDDLRAALIEKVLQVPDGAGPLQVVTGALAEFDWESIAPRRSQRARHATFAVADVGDAQQVEAAARHAVEKFGRIDGWVNNAGVAIYARLIDTPAADHERLFRTNYWGVVNGSLTAVRHLRGSGGAIVNMGSIGSDTPSPVLSAYAATKAAVKRYTQSLQEEVFVDDLPIAVTLMRPSGVSTPLAEHAAVFMKGAARLPPFTYDTSVVAEAIIDALQHDRGEMIVGGTGRLLIPLSHLFPKLRRALATWLAVRFEDRSRKPGHVSNLHRPLGGAMERASEPAARKSSVTTAAARHPWLTRGVLLAGIAIAAYTRRTRRKG